MNDQLDNLVKIRKLKVESATAEEIAGLLQSGENRLIETGRIVTDGKLAGT